jgi:outer membrane biosynthesis protein TonB
VIDCCIPFLLLLLLLLLQAELAPEAASVATQLQLTLLQLNTLETAAMSVLIYGDFNMFRRDVQVAADNNFALQLMQMASPQQQLSQQEQQQQEEGLLMLQG